MGTRCFVSAVLGARIETVLSNMHLAAAISGFASSGLDYFSAVEDETMCRGEDFFGGGAVSFIGPAV